MLDVIIVGAGPAGLSAALILGRCRRNVLVCDTGKPRNSSAQAMHGFLTRDGIAPDEFRRLAREQLRPYESVELRASEVVDAEPQDGHFVVMLQDGTRLTTRKLLLATGVIDELPQIDGIQELYGSSVHHCPYCDGWEVRDQPLAIYGKGEHGYGLALELTVWSRDLVLCTDGPAELEEKQLRRLHDNKIRLCEERIARLDGTDGVLERVVFENGEVLQRTALFFFSEEHQHSPLPEKLGCDFNGRGAVRTGEYEDTCVDGLYVAGDSSRHVQLVIVAAAEGAQAAFAINTELLKEDLTH
ncbi:MAG TPA: NAD(P)/FAD-dependent oxidoreductase [Ktedonobacteraceae bacterium]|nr:NAD(P)/FAD-dependent oxidoreductase [Ktedonobacteraceae bacterium]